MASYLSSVLAAVEDEVREAQSKFPKFNSAHEGKAVIEEELDEMWDAIKANDLTHARAEAVQVAAMAVRFLLDVNRPDPAPHTSRSPSDPVKRKT